VRCTPCVGRAVDVRPDADGAFVIRGVALGQTTLYCTLPDADCAVRLFWLTEAAPTIDVVLTLRRTISAAIVVLDADGRPITSASTARMSERGLVLEDRSNPDPALADPGFDFLSFEELRPDDRSRHVAITQASPRNLSLDDLSLHVTTTQPRRGERIDPANIVELPARETKDTDIDLTTGRWRVVSVYDDTEYYACLMLDDRVLDSRLVTAKEPVIRLRADVRVLHDVLGGIEIFVERDDGKPASDVWIAVLRASHTSRPQVTLTDRTGHAVLTGLTPGDYDVYSKREGLVARRDAARVSAGPTHAVLRLRMARGMRIAGRIEGVPPDASGINVFCTLVELEKGLPDASTCIDPVERWHTGGDRFAFESLPPGQYDIRADDLFSDVKYGPMAVDVRTRSVEDVVLLPQ